MRVFKNIIELHGLILLIFVKELPHDIVNKLNKLIFFNCPVLFLQKDMFFFNFMSAFLENRVIEKDLSRFWIKQLEPLGE